MRQNSATANSALRMPGQDTTTRAAGDPTSATTMMPVPEMRTPDNGRFLKLGYLAASIIYISYLVIMYRRWSSLRARRNSRFSSDRR